jgi:hypothetical protein
MLRCGSRNVNAMLDQAMSSFDDLLKQSHAGQARKMRVGGD